MDIKLPDSCYKLTLKIMSVFFNGLLSDIYNFRHYFTFDDCLEGIIFRVFLPLNDVFSDFLVAAETLQSNENVLNSNLNETCGVNFRYCRLNSFITTSIYLCIIYPGSIGLLVNISRFKESLFGECFQRVLNILILLVCRLVFFF